MLAVYCRQSILGEQTPQFCSTPGLGKSRYSTVDPRDSAVSFAHWLQDDFHISIAFEASELLSPLYQQDAVWSEQVVQAQRLQFALGIDAIEINMEKRDERTAIFVDEREGGAGHILGPRRLESLCNSLHQRGLPRPKVAAQQHDARRRQLRGKRPPKSDRLLRRVSNGLPAHAGGLSIGQGAGKAGKTGKDEGQEKRGRSIKKKERNVLPSDRPMRTPKAQNPETCYRLSCS